MRWHLVLALLVLLALVAEGKKKPAKKPSKGKKPAGVKGECATLGPTLTKKNTKKWTAAGKCPCWWDITKNNCACCKPGTDAMQCGFPMHKFCYARSPKGYGCPGVCNNKYTLSGKGYPCFSDHDNKDCAWCNKVGYQCEQDGTTGPNSKQGSRCSSKKNLKYCQSQQGDCKHIGYCDINATCNKNATIGKYGEYWKCECTAPFEGNGIQCQDENGILSSNPNQEVEVILSMTSGLYSPTHTDGEFSHGASMETLLGDMSSANSACSGAGCESTYIVTES